MVIYGVEKLTLVFGNMSLPFKETISGEKRIRVFTEETDSGEFKWHRDRVDRLVKVLEGNGWQLQLDNELPQILKEGEEYSIPYGVYHRVIKGKGNLKVEITFL